MLIVNSYTLYLIAVEAKNRVACNAAIRKNQLHIRKYSKIQMKRNKNADNSFRGSCKTNLHKELDGEV